MIGNHSRSLAEIEQLIEAFESCRLDPEKFSHHDHLTVALWYVVKLPLPAAIEAFRTNLIRYAAHFQLTVYHETITLFWLKMVAQFVELQDRRQPLPLLLAALLKEFNSSKLIRDYYSGDLLATPAAKAGWQSPDLKPLIS